MLDLIISKYNYWMYIVLMMIGFYAMIGKKNLVKKIIGMNIFQTAIILFFVSAAAKKGERYQLLSMRMVMEPMLFMLPLILTLYPMYSCLLR